jgi:hypothetical protein
MLSDIIPKILPFLKFTKITAHLSKIICPALLKNIKYVYLIAKITKVNYVTWLLHDQLNPLLIN